MARTKSIGQEWISEADAMKLTDLSKDEFNKLRKDPEHLEAWKFYPGANRKSIKIRKYMWDKSYILNIIFLSNTG